MGETDILERLRHVENIVGDLRVQAGRVEETLKSMPTTIKMWQSMGAAIALILAGGWAIFTFAGPGMLKAALAEHLPTVSQSADQQGR